MNLKKRYLFLFENFFYFVTALLGKCKQLNSECPLLIYVTEVFDVIKETNIPSRIELI